MVNKQNKQTDRQTVRQRDRHTDSQAERQTDSQADRQTDRQLTKLWSKALCFVVNVLIVITIIIIIIIIIIYNYNNNNCDSRHEATDYSCSVSQSVGCLSVSPFIYTTNQQVP